MLQHLLIIADKQILMGNTENYSRRATSSEVYLSQLRGWGDEQLMFQSKPWKANLETKLQRKVYQFTSSSDQITSYIQRYLQHNLDCSFMVSRLTVIILCYLYIATQETLHSSALIANNLKQFFLTQIYHELYTVNLKDEITARKRHHQKFKQTQVWYLFYCLLNAVRRFQPFKIKSGHLKTRHLVLNHESGHLKIRNQLTQPDTQVNILPNFFSTQQLKNMRQGRNSRLHPNICQTYSIAIVMLQICTFIQGHSFYDMQAVQINQHVLQRALEMVDQLRYSKLLGKLLRVMVSGPNDRPLPSQLHQILKPYEKQILGLVEFKFQIQKIYENLQNSNVSIDSLY